MKLRIHTDLERAKVLCHQGDLLGSYTLLKRYYDRLPFKPEREHSQLMSMFVWCLCELGRENDLKFYITQLEKLQRLSETPDILYQLGVLNACGKDAHPKLARELLTQSLKVADCDDMRARIKMTLAVLYERMGEDHSSLKTLVLSIPNVEDPSLRIGTELWKGLVHYNVQEFTKAEAHFEKVDRMLKENPDWYLRFVSRLMWASLYFKSDRTSKGVPFLEEARAMLAGKNFKVCQAQLHATEEYLKPKELSSGMRVLLTQQGAYLADSPTSQTFTVGEDTSIRKLLTLLAESEKLSKTAIVEALYSRRYSKEKDDKLIYYHVHNLRKFLKRLGVSGEPLPSDSSGYHLASGLSFKKENI